MMPLEEKMTDGRYEVRAELPDVDPDKDVEITACDGQLTIRAERKDANGRPGVQLRRVRAHRFAADRGRRGPHQRDVRQRHPYRFGADCEARADAETHSCHVWMEVTMRSPDKQWTVEVSIDEHPRAPAPRPRCGGATRR
jgi:hypothetical protein